ncbi:S-layer homology domain-containing protein [Marinicrinis sediminis]|uniref:S-layer homology domain-containing protein n=1 Tax=Marinicrinis sediminis TaxID=1652465 RepID=A0ABW5R8X7_9BACL
MRTHAFQKMIAGWMVMLLMISTLSTAAIGAASDQSAASVHKQVEESLAQVAGMLEKKEPLSPWAAAGLVRAGYTLPSNYQAHILASVVEKRGQYRLVTDLEKTLIALVASGWEDEQVYGYPLLKDLLSHEGMTKQGTNGVMYALIALQAMGYPEMATSEQLDWNVEKLVYWLVQAQHEDGGWSLTVDGDSDPDMTGMALSALSGFDAYAGVQDAMDRGVQWLDEQWLADGFQNKTASESIAQAVIGLASVGIDPAGERFSRDGVSLIEQLLSYRTDSGQYAHVQGEVGNDMATEQAFLALTAYTLYLQEQPGLYEGLAEADVVVHISGPQLWSATSEVEAVEALEALQDALKLENWPYTIQDSSFGAYVTMINGLEQGTYGGYDGWNYAIERSGEWLPGNQFLAMADFHLQDGDQLYVYYNIGTGLTSVQAPDMIQAGQDAVLTVERQVWNWEESRYEAQPLADAQVKIGSKQWNTNEQGQIQATGLAAGQHTVEVRTEADDSSWAAINYRTTLQVAPETVPVHVRVETTDRTLTKQAVMAGDALEALEAALEQADVAYEVADSSFGTYVTAIDDLEQGKYGGWDGWNYAVKRDGSYVPESTYGAMADFSLMAGDELIVYYNHGTAKIADVAIQPAVPQAGDAVTFTVRQQSWDWEQGVPVVTPAAGVDVWMGEKFVTTDEQGIAAFTEMEAGTFNWEVQAYRDTGAKVIKETGTLHVAPSRAAQFTDHKEIAAWAYESVEEAVKRGWLYGVRADKLVFAPKQSLTRAEFAALLNRTLGFAATFSEGMLPDVPVNAWYADEAAAALEAGYVQADMAFRGQEAITRAEMATWIAKALKLESTRTASDYTDLTGIDAAYVPYIETVAENGYIIGYQDSFMPQMSVTREMAAAVILRLP